MKRFAIIALLVLALAGCASATTTQSAPATAPPGNTPTIHVGSVTNPDGSITTTHSDGSITTTAPIIKPTPVTPVVFPKWTITHTFSGNGSKKTEIFTTSDDWKLSWKCDPSSDYFGSYNVIVTVYSADGTYADGAINTICKDGNTSGSTEEHQDFGQIYLDINSEDAWVITIQEMR